MSEQNESECKKVRRKVWLSLSCEQPPLSNECTRRIRFAFQAELLIDVTFILVSTLIDLRKNEDRPRERERVVSRQSSYIEIASKKKHESIWMQFIISKTPQMNFHCLHLLWFILYMNWFRNMRQFVCAMYAILSWFLIGLCGF